MKLLFVENIANVSYNMAKRLRQMGHNVTLITRYNPKAGHLDLASISDEPWVKLFKCESLFDKTVNYLLKILSYKVDIIHCHYALEQGLYGIISRELGKARKVVCHCHGTDLREVSRSKKYGWLVRFNLKYADKVFVSTPDLLQEGTEFLPNPIDTDFFKPMKTCLDLRMGHDYSIFFPSRQVWAHKRQDLFLRALRLLIDKGYDCNLVMIDYGPDAPRTKKLVKKLELDENTCFMPSIHPRKMPQYYNSADVVWAQMGLGHLGLVCLEALACNKPVLVDFMYDHVYPEPPPVIRVYNLQDIVRETMKLLDSKRFRVNTRQWIVKHHSYKIILTKLLDIYNEMLSKDD